MIDVESLRYGDVLVPTAGASGYVYVYLGIADPSPVMPMYALFITGKYVKTEITYMSLANPRAWDKIEAGDRP